MKLFTILTISILLSSCGTTSSRNRRSKQADENWEMASHTFTSNTYNSRGLLDTSHEVMYMYLKGMFFDSVVSIVIRKYKNDKLTSKKEFTLSKDGTRELSGETINQYDAAGNLVTAINNVAGFFTKVINEYNNKNLAIKTIVISQKIPDGPEDYNIDSIVAHHSDKKHFQYDTTISTYEYDPDSNPIHIVVSDTKGIPRETYYDQYSGHEKIFSFGITPQGDTITKTIYTHEGNFVKEIAEMRKTGTIDTIWFDKKKIVKDIMLNYETKIKYKSIHLHNSKGDDIEDIDYKQAFY